MPARPPWTLDDLFSAPRLTPYLTTCRDDLVAALRLYDWNVRISSAFHESLHYVEIGLRNVMDRQLTTWARRHGATVDWYLDPVVPLTQPTRDVIAKARRDATRGGVPEVHGKVIAELTFGFWWSLLSARYNRTLWPACLRYAFDGSVRQQALHSALDTFRLLRNRIAHHEPIHARDLAADYELIRDTAGRISPLLRAQVESTSRVIMVLQTRPPLPGTDKQATRCRPAVTISKFAPVSMPVSRSRGARTSKS